MDRIGPGPGQERSESMAAGMRRQDLDLKLKNKWGKYFSYRTTKMGENTNVRVPRRAVINI